MLHVWIPISYPSMEPCLVYIYYILDWKRCVSYDLLHDRVNSVVDYFSSNNGSFTYEALYVSVPQGNLTHPELLVAVEMLSSVVLMNEALDVGDRGALWKQLSSTVTGLSNVEDEYAQRWAPTPGVINTSFVKSWVFLREQKQTCKLFTPVLLRYMDELMRLKAAAREEGSDYLTWNDIQACIDQVNLAVQEEHERKRPHDRIHSRLCQKLVAARLFTGVSPGRSVCLLISCVLPGSNHHTMEPRYFSKVLDDVPDAIQKMLNILLF